MIESARDLDAIDRAALLPGVLKLSRLGYDGKGQIRVHTFEQLRAAYSELGEKPCVLERLLDLAKEISVVVVRDFAGELVSFPAAENEHSNGILEMSIVPARVESRIATLARESTISVAQELDYRGVLCVEFFVLRDGQLLANEIAPRPHNSGHWSIDGSLTSQFEQQCRVLAGLPLGETSQHTPAVMVNLLGDIWYNSPSARAWREPDWGAVLADPCAKLRLYGKQEARCGRKMGHVTCLGSSIDDALEAAARAKRILGIPHD